MRLFVDSLRALKEHFLGSDDEHRRRKEAVDDAARKARDARFAARQAALDAIAQAPPGQFENIDMRDA